jgi:hypothetical protein
MLMTAFDQIKSILTEDVPAAKVQNAELMAEITRFQEDWKRFEEIRDKAQSPTAAAVAARNYRAA